METGREKGLHERRLLIGYEKSILREKLLQKAKDTVDTFLSDLDEKIKSNGNLYIHCNLLIRNTVDTKLEEFITTVDNIRSEMDTAYDIFEHK